MQPQEIFEFQCRKRQCYTRDTSNSSILMVHPCCFNAASGNAIRATSYLGSPCPKATCFNAASGNAIRATKEKKDIMLQHDEVSMPQAAMLYARQKEEGWEKIEDECFNAASGNAIRATRSLRGLQRRIEEFQCRKRQCYTRDSSSEHISIKYAGFNAASGNAIRATWRRRALRSKRTIVSMPQAAMLYARRPSVSFKNVR